MFAHPTVPAAILARLGPTTIARIHRELGEHLPNDDDRAAVHLASSTSEPDEQIASALERAPGRRSNAERSRPPANDSFGPRT